MFDIWSEKLRGRMMPEYEAGNIQINANLNNGEYCYVFCSSNNIWYPNTQKRMSRVLFPGIAMNGRISSYPMLQNKSLSETFISRGM